MIGDYLKPCDICGKEVHRYSKLCPHCFSDPNQKLVNYEMEALANGAQKAQESRERVTNILKDFQESKERNQKIEKKNAKKAKVITEEDNELSSLIKLGHEQIAIDAVKVFYDCTFYEAGIHIKNIKDCIEEGDYDFPLFLYNPICALINNAELGDKDIFGNPLSADDKKEYYDAIKKEEAVKQKANDALKKVEEGSEEKKLADRFFQLKNTIISERKELFKDAMGQLKSDIENGNTEIIKQKKKWFSKDFSLASTCLYNADYNLRRLFSIGRHIDLMYSEKVKELRTLYQANTK